jgi:hypothetical protein
MGQYCIPVFQNSCATSGYINKFTFNTLSNANSGCNGNPDNYILYPATGGTTTTVQLGGTYSLSLKSVGNDGFGVWIDYNDDADFDDANEMVYSSPFFGSNLFSGTVIIPNNNDYTGQRRMRVRGSLETLLQPTDACTTLLNGETEDYIITIDPAPACSGVPVAGIVTAFPSSICAGGNTSELHLSGYTIASNIEIQWQSSTDNTNWSDIPDANEEVYTTDPLYDTTFYRAAVTCTNSNQTTYSNSIKITIGEVELLSVLNDTICGPGTATLEATANAEMITWYENESGGLPIYTSSSPSQFQPDVSGDSVFYVSASSGVTYIDSVGLIGNSNGSGSDAFLNDYEIFNVYHACQLVGVYVYPSEEGNVIIQLRDHNFSPLKTDTFVITSAQVNQKTFLQLDYDLPNGNGYQLTLKDGSVPLWSTQSGVNYPYQIPNVISLFNSNLGPVYYFYFYNWIINFSDQCETPRMPVFAVVNNSPPLTITADPGNGTICGNAGLAVNLEASAGYTHYSWLPAAGLSDTSGTNVVATPTVTTTYTVFASDSICHNNASFTVVIANTPSVTISTTSDSICGGVSTQLFATATPLLNYRVEQIDYTIDTTSGSEVLLDEDEVSAALPIGFTFKFYGNFYHDFRISSNGFISFDTAATDGCCAGQKLPDLALPNNLIAFAWEDYSPQSGGSVSYYTTGVPPNRKLVIRFDSLLHYSLSGSNDPVTSRIELYETSNNIEIHTLSMPGNPNGLWFNHTEGIENATGTLAAFVPGRNADASWTATNDGWRFTPVEYSYSWTPSATLDNSQVSDPIATPAVTTNYTVTVTDTASQCSATGNIKIRVITTPEPGSITPSFSIFCDEGMDTLALSGYTSGAALQWQQSSESGGPYTDIAGATNASYVTPLLDVPSYYTVKVSCINPATTAESIMDVLPVPPPPQGDSVVRCGIGKVDLQVTGSGGNILWYDAETGGNYLGSGTPFTSLPISQTTTFWAEEGPPVSPPLTATFIGGNLGDGNMFDITASNTIVITGFDGHLAAAAVADVEIYYKKDGYAGFENISSAWTFAGSAFGVTGEGIGIPTPYPIALNITIPAGQTYAFYITSKTADVNYTYGTVTGNVFASDDNIEIKEGNAINYAFGNFTEPVQWNGIVHYNTVGCASERTPINATLYFPQIDATVSEETICEGDTILLTAFNAGMGNYNYQWMPLLSGMIPSDGKNDSVIVAPEHSTLFSVTATEVNNTCDTLISIFVLVNPAPVASFTGLPDTMEITDTPVTLTGSPTGGSFSGAGITGDVFDPAVAGIGGPYPITYSYTDGNGCDDDTVEEVVVVLEIGINDPLSSSHLRFYPNPGDGHFTMQLKLPVTNEKVTINFYDVYGRRVYEKQMEDGAAALQQSFDFSDWAKGNYFAEVRVGANIFRAKVIIE